MRDTTDTHIRRDIAEGVRWLMGHAAVRTLALVIFAFNITWGAAWSVLVLYSLDHLHMGEVGFGLLTSAAAIGGLIGTVFFGRIERTFSLATVMRTCLLLEVLTHLALALTTVGWVAMVLMVVFGAYAFVWGTVSQTVRQRVVPTELQGRVGSVYMVGVFGGLVVGQAHRRLAGRDVGPHGAVLVRLRGLRPDAGAGVARARAHRRCSTGGGVDLPLSGSDVLPGARACGWLPGMRTQVGIVGAGPAGLFLSHLLAERGIDSVVVDNRSRAYAEARIRAGVLEAGSVEALTAAGLGDRLHREGLEHDGIYLQFDGERHHLDFQELVGRSVWVYGQTEVVKDLLAARDAQGDRSSGRSLTRLCTTSTPTTRPSPTSTRRARPRCSTATSSPAATASTGSAARASRATLRVWDRTYPYSWLGILADVAPSTDELIYAWHPDGFAMHSMRSPA